VSLLPVSQLDESDTKRARRLKPTKKLKFRTSDHEAGDDSLTVALHEVWSHSAMWGRALRDYLKETRGTNLTLEHCRDLLAAALARRPLSWTMIIRSRPSRLLVETLANNLENEDSRIFIQPDLKDHASIWRDEATARKALQAHGQEALRRRWYENRVATIREIEALSPRQRQADWLPAAFIA
jgi:hypothetical protein